METAKRIDEFTPDGVCEDWMWVYDSVLDFQKYKSYPKVVEYSGERYYKMSYNSDTNKVNYRKAEDRPYHLRYAN